MSNSDLQRAAHQVAGAAADARAWIDAVRDHVAAVTNEADALVGLTRQVANLARKVGNGAGRRACVGVFGPSQAGKSYLVSALARPGQGRLTARLAASQLDFLTEINPPGDRESTGLVTRFTIHPPAVEADHPVELRLLSETDLVKVLANSFFSDFDPNNMVVRLADEDRLRTLLAEARAQAHGRPAAHLDEVALFDLGDYFRRCFPSRIAAFDRTEYWEEVIRLAPLLPVAGRARLYAPLWAELEPFTALFIHLLSALAALDHAGAAHAGLEALVPRQSSIIDVAILGNLASPDDVPVSVRPLDEKGAAGAARPVPRATLAALVAEVTIAMAERPWPFLEHTDLLDFPGARSRLKLVDLPAQAEERQAQLRELLLRGKIAYLFQRFTEERELTAMLLCMPPSVAEVKDLAPMVRGWIELTHGADAAARRRVGNALFLVLTKFDLEFLEKGGETAQSRHGKWERRLHASVLELYGRDGWLDDWNGKPFANTVFLRNPGMKQEHLMDYAEIGRDADGSERLVEAGPAAKKAELIEEYRRALVDSSLCRRHFDHIEETWAAAFAANDGGVRFLVGRLDGVLDPDLKARQLRQRLEDQAALLAAELGRFYHADSERQRREADTRLVEARRRWAMALRPPGTAATRLGPFIETLQIPESDVRQVFLNVAALKLDEMTAEPPAAADPWADDPWADAPPAGTAPPRPSHDRPAIFAERLLNHWTLRLHAGAQNSDLSRRLGLDGRLYGDFARELIVGAHRLGLGERIATALRGAIVSASARWDQMGERAALLGAGVLNDYVAGLGFDALAETERPGFPEPPKDARERIFAPPPPTPGLPELAAQRLALEDVRLRDWGVAFRALGVANVAHAGGRDLTEAQNARLGVILSHLAPATG